MAQFTFMVLFCNHSLEVACTYQPLWLLASWGWRGYWRVFPQPG